MPQTLDEFWNSTNWGLLESLNGWKVTREGALVYLSLSARDGERYRVRFGCDGYSGAPPSVVFVNDQGAQTDLRAWPRGNQNFHQVFHQPPHCFLCMPLTREGLAHHPDWRNSPALKPWSESKTLLDLFNFLQRSLNGVDYIGRGL